PRLTSIPVFPRSIRDRGEQDRLIVDLLAAFTEGIDFFDDAADQVGWAAARIAGEVVYEPLDSENLTRARLALRDSIRVEEESVSRAKLVARHGDRGRSEHEEGQGSFARQGRYLLPRPKQHRRRVSGAGDPQAHRRHVDDCVKRGREEVGSREVEKVAGDFVQGAHWVRELVGRGKGQRGARSQQPRPPRAASPDLRVSKITLSASPSAN